MKIFDDLFLLGTILAFFAGLAEIRAGRNRWLHHLPRNVMTPLLLMIVKMVRVPKFVMMYRASSSALIPMVSSIGAVIVWMIAFIFSVLPSPKGDDDDHDHEKTTSHHHDTHTHGNMNPDERMESLDHMVQEFRDDFTR